MKILFLDESGDHNLSIIDPQYPLFVLGGVIVDMDYADRSVCSRKANQGRSQNCRGKAAAQSPGEL
ncbi:hypothetical protein ES703_108872 [subsurface metagenome]